MSRQPHQSDIQVKKSTWLHTFDVANPVFTYRTVDHITYIPRMLEFLVEIGRELKHHLRRTTIHRDSTISCYSELLINGSLDNLLLAKAVEKKLFREFMRAFIFLRFMKE